MNSPRSIQRNRRTGHGLVPTLAVLVLAALAPAWADSPGQAPPIRLAAPHPDQATLEAAFEQASADYGVPVVILKAVAFAESRWVHTGPTMDQGYGIMHLVDNDYSRTLEEAAALLGLPADELKTDPIANIRGGAALIARYADETVGTPEALEDYWQALKRFTGLLPDVQTTQALEYYHIIRDGAAAVNGLGMEIIIEPAPIDMSRLDVGYTVQPQAPPDYAGAIWNPADSSNYTASRSQSIDRWVNHWIGSGTYAGAISWFKNPSSNVSAHFVIRHSDGELTQMVRISHTGWHCGTWNSRSIGIEHEATPSGPYWPAEGDACRNHPMMIASAAVCAYFCDLNGIPKTRTYIVGHNEVPNAATACPGPLPWNTYIEMVNGIEPSPKFRNTISNGGFESDMDSWTQGSSTTTEILTSGAHRGSKCCKFYRSGGYATIWQNPSEVTGEVWRTTCWAYRNSGMTSTEFGFKDQSGNTEASTAIGSGSWQFYSVDWTIADDIDVQAWGTGAAGVVIDDVRCNRASKMNWITSWVLNGPHAADLETDFFDSDGGEADLWPDPGDQDGGQTWTTFSRGDGFIDIDEAFGGLSTCVTYAHVYVHADVAKTGVNLIVGADDGIKVLLNGTVVHVNDADSSHDYFNPDEDVIEGLTLNAGVNRLMVKVRENGGSYSFSARFCDDDGNAIGGLTYDVVGPVRPVPGDFDADRDVDLDDFAHVQNCLSGPTIAQDDPDCQNAKFDADSDVDTADLAVFQNCITGAGVEGDPDCAG